MLPAYFIIADVEALGAHYHPALVSWPDFGILATATCLTSSTRLGPEETKLYCISSSSNLKVALRIQPAAIDSIEGRQDGDRREGMSPLSAS